MEKTVKIDNIIYSIDLEKRTAGVMKSESVIDIIIPRHIIYESNEYIVTCIFPSAFRSTQIKSIQFPQNSELQTICKNAFSNSKIESLSIPKSLVELEEGWCSETSKLINIDIDINNPRYSIYENGIIIGKTSIEDNHYENLIFCSRDIKTIKIPNFIKYISSHAFSRCSYLHNIEITEESKLENIGNYGFYYSMIKEINIPNNITHIGEYAFSHCQQLQRIKITNKSLLYTLEKSTFSYSSIEYFSIPSHLKEIKENVFFGCSNLQIIEFDGNSEIEKILYISFKYLTNQTLIMIPNKLAIKIDIQ